MIHNLNTIRKQVLGLSLSEASFKSRGFEQGHEAQPRLELVAKTVVHGYNVAIENGWSEDLQVNTSQVKDELVGFFHEGIGMGLYVLDVCSLFNKNRFWKFVKGWGHKHEYMSYIGAGLASGVFNLPIEDFLKTACPTSGCLILDGLGFYNAYFKSRKTLQGFYIPDYIKANDFFLERYDNGIGRAIWFYNSGEPHLIAYTVSTFPSYRRAAIWSGIGLAATYAGGIGEDKLRLLKTLSGEHAIMLAQGSVLATHTRHRAGNPHQHDTTEQILIGKSSIECHLFATEAKNDLQERRYIDGRPSFQVFLENIRRWIQGDTANAQISQFKTNAQLGILSVCSDHTAP
jgi:enediyne biosynthesis protein E3